MPTTAALLRAVRRLLRPLVRLLIRRGITYPVVAELLRTLFVEVALRDVLADARARSDSRVSLMTGVHRKELRRLRHLDRQIDPIPPLVTMSSQIIARWLGTPAFLDANGHPAPLPRLPRPDSNVSFEALVAAVTTDVRPRAVLDDWLDQAIVTLGSDDKVRLNVAAFLPRDGGEAQMYYFARNLHDHIAAAAANVTASDAAPFLDRSVHYDALDAETAQRLEAAARDAAQRALLEVNRVALDLLEAATKDAAGATRRVNFGTYVYVEDEPPPEAPSA